MGLAGTGLAGKRVAGKGVARAAVAGAAAITLPVSLTLLTLAGCATDVIPPPQANHGMSCLDDSSHCIAQRQAALRNLVGRSDRHWVRENPSVDSYASGVRLFAFKKKKKDLNCDELRHAQREAGRADAVLRGPDGRRLSPAQVSRGSMFAAEVAREMSREIARRCLRG